MKEQGKTIIIITHKLEEVLAISDEVTVMRDGKVVGTFKTAETSAEDLARMIVGRDVLLRVEKTTPNPETVSSKCGTFKSWREAWPDASTMFHSKCVRARSSALPASKATARRN